jgi:hypothetical protein
MTKKDYPFDPHLLRVKLEIESDYYDSNSIIVTLIYDGIEISSDSVYLPK